MRFQSSGFRKKEWTIPTPKPDLYWIAAFKPPWEFRLMEPLLSLYLVNLFAALGLMTIAWCVSVLIKNAGVADIFWGLGFGLIACLTFVMGNGYPPRAILLAVLASLAYMGAEQRGAGRSSV